MGLVSTALHFREGLCVVFHWKCLRMLTTPLRQLTGGRYQVDCWFSRTQKCVTVSTSEAEYVALGNAVKELPGIVFETDLAFYVAQ